MITTVTLNASIDKAYHICKTVIPGTVMRVTEVRNTAGGKGLNVARIIKLCGEEVQATGLIGGYNGSYLEQLLNQDGILHNFYIIKGETRSCINILAEDLSSTEFLEPGCEVTKKEIDEYIDRFSSIINDCDLVTLAGSIPKGVPVDIYASLIKIAKKSGKKVLLDTSGEYLTEGLKAKPTLVKPNKEELEALFGISLDSLEDAVLAGKKLYAKGIPYVVISLGSNGALLICKEGTYHGVPPALEAVNTVGCGDSMVGAFAVAMSRNYNAKESLRFAVAVSASNALSKETGNFKTEDCKRILKEVVIHSLDE